jgi:hypothetical protein
MIVPYPTLADLAKRAALLSVGARLEAPGTKALVGALRRIGGRFG